MHGTSAFCLQHADHIRRAARHHPGRCGMAGRSGFTLLELLVVLALAAGLVAIVAPSGLRAIESARIRAAERSLVSFVEGLPLKAWRSGKPLECDDSCLLHGLADWPADWRVSVSSPLQYSPQGVARGGSIKIMIGGRVVGSVQVEPVTGTSTVSLTK